LVRRQVLEAPMPRRGHDRGGKGLITESIKLLIGWRLNASRMELRQQIAEQFARLSNSAQIVELMPGFSERAEYFQGAGSRDKQI
jgi:hypothetical protein